MKERWIWITGLVFSVLLILSAGDGLSSKLTAFAILVLAAIACEAITRLGLAKAAKIR